MRTPVEFTCDATNTTTLTWKINNTTIRTLHSSGVPTDGLIAVTNHNGIKVQLVSLSLAKNTRDRANLTSRLVVDSSALMFGDQISCVSSSGAEPLVYTIRGRSIMR